ncbi:MULTISPECIES: putative T6SS immunity periplasmic lipoprotein [Citrobacter]|uniref:putative T6SS immunity periplasmic lipoprotein n=1 Tax=Citrobacter TaxID=544 RepID=UPI0019075D4E|nr:MULTISPECIES: putative T6SS immunity periplasmic lipoprotein [Citrobacter]EGT0621389.1 hypothetical protein [Citrobacter braakii]MBJ8847062.1 hypothetical protein [Citrobacter braakii]MDM3469357.1 hypothetical protein [Citrobacter sp. Cb041]
MIKNRAFFTFSLLSCCLVILSGCPGYGDRAFTDEEAVVSVIGNNICFWVKDSEKYQPSIITVTRRGADFGNEKFILNPPLILLENKWCITPDVYIFPDSGQFVVTYTLGIPYSSDRPRSIVSGVEFSNGRIFNIHLTDMEIARPYSAMDK